MLFNRLIISHNNTTSNLIRIWNSVTKKKNRWEYIFDIREENIAKDLEVYKGLRYRRVEMREKHRFGSIV